MRREEEILAHLQRLVRDENLTSTPVLREAVQAGAALLTALAEGTSPTAFRAAALLGKALERLGRGLWPVRDDVRVFLGECIRAIADALGAPPAADEIPADRIGEENVEAHSDAASEPLFLATVDDVDALVDDDGDPARPPAARRDAATDCRPEAGSGGTAAAAAGGPTAGTIRQSGGVAGQIALLTSSGEENDTACDCRAASGSVTPGPAELAEYKSRIHDLCFRGAPKAPEILAGILRSGAHHELRALAAAYLGALRPPEAGEQLACALCDESPAVRSAALGALVRFGGEIAELATARAALDEDAWVRFEAQLWRTRLARAPVAPLCPMLSAIGLCDRPGACVAPDCDWETAGRGDFCACPRWRIEADR